MYQLNRNIGSGIGFLNPNRAGGIRFSNLNRASGIRFSKPSKKQILMAFVLMIFSLTACQTELSVLDIPNENKLVVQSFISPQDTVLSVRVTNTNAVIGQVSKTFKLIANASVTISNGTQKITLPYTQDGYYQLSAKQLPIIAGKTYFLQVTTPDGRSVSGECTIPANTVDAKKVVVNIQSINNNTKQVTVKWEDISNEQNYYALTGTYETLKKECSGMPTYIRDKGRDGQSIFHNFNTDLICGNGNPNFIVIVANYDLNGYQYISTVVEQNDVNGVPFTEPVQIYTNIKGGYGVFSGYNQFRTMVKMF